MDLYIETLTGTVFELHVSPFETILSIKAKIQHLEGIPISQQHLVWQAIQLDDEYCLHDYNIGPSATLKLVLAMRGGPINTRRVSIEDPSLQEMADYMDANRDEIWETLMQDNQQVTLLVFRDGDQLNFFRVFDRGDGTLTPYSESISPHSDGDDAEVSDGSDQMAKKDNATTKQKMEALQQQLAVKSGSTKKVPKPPSIPSLKNTKSSLAKRRIHFTKSTTPKLVAAPSRSGVQPSRHGVVPKTESAMQQYDLSELTPSPTKSPTKVSSRLSRLAVLSRADDDDKAEVQTTAKESARRRILPPLTSKDGPSLPKETSTGHVFSMQSIAESMSGSVKADSKPSTAKSNRRLSSKQSLKNSAKAASHNKQPSSRQGTSGKPSTSAEKKVATSKGTEEKASCINVEAPTYKAPLQLPRIEKGKTAASKEDIPSAPDKPDKPSRKATKVRSRRHMLKPIGTLEAKSPIEVASTSPQEVIENEVAGGGTTSREAAAASVMMSPPYYDQIDEILKEAQLQDLLRDSIEFENYKKLLSWVRPRLEQAADAVAYPPPGFGYHTYGAHMTEGVPEMSTREQSRPGKTSPDHRGPRLRSSKVNLRGGGPTVGSQAGLLPPVTALPTTSKKRLRCAVCTKKLGLATTYHCRCGVAFCGVHRYPEAHPCDFDFKTEGRKFLEKSNPVVAAQKLPKI